MDQTNEYVHHNDDKEVFTILASQSLIYFNHFCDASENQNDLTGACDLAFSNASDDDNYQIQMNKNVHICDICQHQNP